MGDKSVVKGSGSLDTADDLGHIVDSDITHQEHDHKSRVTSEIE